MAADHDPDHWVPLSGSGYAKEDFGPLLLWMLFEGTTCRFDVPEAWLPDRCVDWLHNHSLAHLAPCWPEGIRHMSQVTRHFGKGFIDGRSTIQFASNAQAVATWARLKADERFAAFMASTDPPTRLLGSDQTAGLPIGGDPSPPQALAQPAGPSVPATAGPGRLGARSKAPAGHPAAATPDSPRGAHSIMDFPAGAEIALARLFPSLPRSFPSDAQLAPGNTFSRCTKCGSLCFGQGLSNNCTRCPPGTAVIYRITAENTARRTAVPERRQTGPRPKPPPADTAWPANSARGAEQRGRLQDPVAR